MSKLIKKILPLVLTFTISIIIALLIGEFVIRLFYPQVTSPVQFFYDDKLGGMVGVPNQKGFRNHPGVYYYEYQNNDLGMRDTRNVADYSKYAYRIMCIGDSFTYGWGVNDNETFASVLQNRINNDSVAVINAGASGTSTDYALKFFQVRGKELNPNTLIYFCFDNDITDNMVNAYFHIENDSIIANPENSYSRINSLKKNRLANSWVYNWLSSHSQLFGMIRYNIGVIWNRKVQESNQKTQTVAAEAGPSVKTPEQHPDTKVAVVAKPGVSSVSPQDTLYHTCKYISALDRETRKQGVKFMVFYIPAHTSLRELRKTGTIKTEKVLSKYCAENEIKFFSFREELTRVNNPIETFYLPVDFHWNQQGHAMAGNYIYKVLKQEKIVH